MKNEQQMAEFKERIMKKTVSFSVTGEELMAIIWTLQFLTGEHSDKADRPPFELLESTLSKLSPSASNLILEAAVEVGLPTK